MRICYDKLWSILKDNKMKKCDKAEAAEITPYSMGKLFKDELVSLDIIALEYVRYFAVISVI